MSLYADGLQENSNKTMKVLIVNTSEKTGGAAIAANRLLKALNRNGVDATMLVRDKQSSDKEVITLGTTLRTKWNFIWERFVIWIYNRLDRKKLFHTSIANSGTDITKLKEFNEADIIHLHWINQGMLSLNDIDRIAKSGKPIIWTMHDMWACTGICHHARECNNYHKECNHCHYLYNNGTSNDLSTRIFKKKYKLYKSAPITFITCSKWLRDRAKQSALLQNHIIIDIPNPIDTGLFRPIDKLEARKRESLPTDKKLILFGAAKITDKRKGIDYFIECCRILAERYPELQKNLGIVVYGNGAEELKSAVPFQVFPLNYIDNEKKIVDIYNAVDVFVTPSLEENLPNTIMEALACGLPCVGFNVGGIPEMIEHKVNGYVSEYKSAADLANGIHWTLQEATYDNLRKAAVEKVEKCYSEQIVAEKYIQIYDSMTNKNR